MGYVLHIERENRPLSYNGWIAAVEDADSARLASGSMTVTDPHSGEAKSWKLPDGTAEIQIGDEWIPVFYWNQGSVDFRLGDFPEAVLSVALDLASKMNAYIESDEGERYTCLDDLLGNS